MLLTAAYSSLLIAALARTGSAAAIDSSLTTRNKIPININVPGWVNGAVNSVGGAINNVGTAATSLIPGGLIPDAVNCPKIIQQTNWDQYLGVAPVAKAVNQPCSWSGIMTDVWHGISIWNDIKCGGKCLLAFVQEDLNVLQDATCANCLGQVMSQALPCINAAGGFQTICTKATAIPGVGPCLTGTKNTPGICPKPPANPRIVGTS